ncbi:MAG: glycosyltransferase [Lachnospiraceae bacterium]|nr:glycosyltransferase [Lachnospiraceae bacterium]
MIKKIMYIANSNLTWIDIPISLKEMGRWEIVSENVTFHVKAYSDEGVKECRHLIRKNNPDCIISCDFSRNIARAAYEESIPYLSWVYDCPHEALYSIQAFYPTNYIFLFDRMQCEHLMKIGLRNIFHMPLAINPARITEALSNINKKEPNTDICFVGSLYDMTDNEILLSNLSGTAKERWDDIAESFMFRWDGNINFSGILPDDFIMLFDDYNTENNKSAIPFMKRGYKYEANILARYIAHRERIRVLNDLSKKYELAFYTRDHNLEKLDSSVNIRDGVSYESGDLFRIYNRSRININISLHCIETGLPQRIFDVMGAGGFMLSNYQSEIEDLFLIGEEIETFKNIEELNEKTEYYLRHEQEREKIAAKGQEKVLKLHSYKNRFNEIIPMIEKSETNKKQSYSIRSEEKMAVSVIIPTYNRLFTLPRAVQSVLEQSYKNLELIIVDDGSDDGTDEYVKTITDSRVVYIKGEHKGAGAARNTGVRRSKYELIAFCDSDCEWKRDKLTKQIELMEKNDGCVMVYSRFATINSDGSNGMIIPVDDIPECECSGYYLYQHLLVHNLIGTPTMLIKKEVFERTGGFDESLPALEDYDLALKIAEKHDVRCCYEILVNDYPSVGSLSSNVSAYFTVRCMLIAKYVTELKKYGTFDTIVNYILERAAKHGIQQQVGEMLIRMLERRIEK